MNPKEMKVPNTKNNDHLTVFSSLILIFAFSAVDLAISPLVKVFHGYYSIPMEKILWLISYCTLGIVIGVFTGPAITRTFRVNKVAGISSFTMALSLALFLIVQDFTLALILRVIFGISVGIISTVMWWLAYHGVSKESMHPMITVMMAARPLAVALGVPLTGMIAMTYGWKNSFSLLLGLILISSFLLYRSMPEDKDEKSSFCITGIINEYTTTLKIPWSITFFTGLMINKICYFGFYSMAGIWFMKYYKLTPFNIAGILLYIGLGEASINFVIPVLIKRFGQKAVFITSIIAGGIFFSLLFRGNLPLKASIALFALFAMMDRIYSMAMVVKLPEMFSECTNKTVMGSMVTLSAWISLMGISWVQGSYLDKLGIQTIGYVLMGSFVTGSAILYFVQHKTIYSKNQ